MGLDPTSISTWNAIKETLLSKYQEYCKVRDLREDMFRMIQKEEDILEDYVE